MKKINQTTNKTLNWSSHLLSNESISERAKRYDFMDAGFAFSDTFVILATLTGLSLKRIAALLANTKAHEVFDEEGFDGLVRYIDDTLDMVGIQARIFAGSDTGLAISVLEYEQSLSQEDLYKFSVDANELRRDVNKPDIKSVYQAKEYIVANL
jgi:hypothetical protein